MPCAKSARRARARAASVAISRSLPTTCDRLLGISHPETIAVLHNMAELADARGDAAEAERLRRRIMDLLGVEEAEGGEASGGASRGAQEAV